MSPTQWTREKEQSTTSIVSSHVNGASDSTRNWLVVIVNLAYHQSSYYKLLVRGTTYELWTSFCPATLQGRSLKECYNHLFIEVSIALGVFSRRTQMIPSERLILPLKVPSDRSSGVLQLMLNRYKSRRVIFHLHFKISQLRLMLYIQGGHN